MSDKHPYCNNSAALVLVSVFDLYPRAVDRFFCDYKGKDVSAMRYIASYMLKKHVSNITLKDIAELLQRENHTTVIHAIRTAEEKYGSDEEFTAAYELAEYNHKKVKAQIS